MKKIKLNKGNPRLFGVYPAEAIFYEWLDLNIHRFTCKPVLQESCKDYAIYSFENIIGNITLTISFESLLSTLYFDNLPGFYKDDDACFEMYDIAYIEEEQYHLSKGYCVVDEMGYDYDYDYKYFTTQSELYINTIFEPTMVYINKMFLPENSLYLINYGEMTTGFIARTENDPDYIAKEAKGVGISCCHHFRGDNADSLVVKGGYELHKHSLFV